MSVTFPEIDGPTFAAAPDPGGPTGQVEEPGINLAPASPELAGDLIEWTPERGAAIARALGLGLHMLDPATALDGGEDLWRATAEEATAMGAPLARILARYTPTRRLAGVVDEVELGAAFVDYTKRNLAERGRAVAAARDVEPPRFGVGGGED